MILLHFKAEYIVEHINAVFFKCSALFLIQRTICTWADSFLLRTGGAGIVATDEKDDTFRSLIEVYLGVCCVFVRASVFHFYWKLQVSSVKDKPTSSHLATNE